MCYKKIFSILILLFVIVACNSDNGKEDVSDPVYNAKYTPLKSLDELGEMYYYVGAKVGNRSFRAISESNCLANNSIYFKYSDSKDKSDLVLNYTSYKPNEIVAKLCVRDFIRTISIIKVLSEGKLLVKISEIMPIRNDFPYENGIIPNENLEDDESEKDMEKLEIGMQGGYLRIEDKLSRNTFQEKSYLYFKKR